MNETVEFPLPHMNWFSVCYVSYRQVFTDGICITKNVVFCPSYTTVWCKVRLHTINVATCFNPLGSYSGLLNLNRTWYFWSGAYGIPWYYSKLVVIYMLKIVKIQLKNTVGRTSDDIEHPLHKDITSPKQWVRATYKRGYTIATYDKMPLIHREVPNPLS